MALMAPKDFKDEQWLCLNPSSPDFPPQTLSPNHRVVCVGRDLKDLILLFSQHAWFSFPQMPGTFPVSGVRRPEKKGKADETAQVRVPRAGETLHGSSDSSPEETLGSMMSHPCRPQGKGEAAKKQWECWGLGMRGDSHTRDSHTRQGFTL